MTGHRAMAGLSLLCALAFCAFAAPGASAEGTTAFTCVKNQGKLDFKDAHCTESTEPNQGLHGHLGIANDQLTEIELSNANTASNTTGAEPSLLAGELAGIKKTIQISCKTIKGTGSLTNKEEKGTMLASGSVTIEHSECAVTKPSGCIVKEPIVYEADFKTYGNEIEMGLEFTGKKAGEFGTVTYKNKGAEKCFFNEKTFGISGAFKGRPGNAPQGKGTTLWFDEGETLKFHGGLGELTGAMRWNMKNGNPIAFTT